MQAFNRAGQTRSQEQVYRLDKTVIRQATAQTTCARHRRKIVDRRTNRQTQSRMEPLKTWGDMRKTISVDDG
jgi:hypothetical protein